MMAIIFYYLAILITAILVPEHRTFPFRSPFFNDFTLLMNLQNKTSLGLSLATINRSNGFIDYLFNLNFTSRLPYPWSLPVQLNSSVNLISFYFFFMVNKRNRFC
jgi:hypothetical protein